MSARIIIIKKTLTVDTSTAYEDGDTLDGKLIFETGMKPVHGRVLCLRTIGISDDSIVDTSALELFFFHDDPVNTSFVDNGPLTIASVDMDQYKFSQEILQNQFTSTVGGSHWSIESIDIPFERMENLFAVLVARGAKNFTAPTDLSITFTCETEI